MKRFFKILLIFIITISILFIANNMLKEGNSIFNQTLTNEVTANNQQQIDKQGKYTSKEEVALYIFTYGELPSNYVNKTKAKQMGWVAGKGNLTKVCEGCSIGGDVFTNRQKSLPTKKGRTYYECDIDYQGGTRNGKRIVYSNDGLIYYTDDHYNSFELLYGEP